MNICVECKHIKKNAFCETKFHECQHPDCRNVVSGRAFTYIELRKPKGVCGVEGKLYEVGTVGQTVKRPLGPPNVPFGMCAK